jgi:short-subunit dehydrogenase
LGSDKQWALITGASSGIGRALAYAFAARGYSLFLTARNDLALRQVAAECASRFRVTTEIHPADLSDPQAVGLLVAAFSQMPRAFEILVNNAGFGVHGEFRNTPLDHEIAMIDVQVEAVLKLTKALLPGMISRGSGRILNVASLYSFAPVPYQSVYAASKAFMLSFTLGLSKELKNTGVTLTLLCPGVTQTEFRSRAGITEKSKTAGATAESVAEIAARETLKGELLVVPGFFNKLFVFLARRLPLLLVLYLVTLINRRRGMHD